MNGCVPESWIFRSPFDRLRANGRILNSTALTLSLSQMREGIIRQKACASQGNNGILNIVLSILPEPACVAETEEYYVSNQEPAT